MSPTPPKHNGKQQCLAIHGTEFLTGSARQAQTLEQRRRNAKFVKDQEARRGKSEEQIKKRTKEAAKSPISIFWLGTSNSKRETVYVVFLALTCYYLVALLGFVVFGGLVFEVLSRFFL